MPVNAPTEYFKAEAKFHSAKNKEEKIAALEEMIRLLPRHHGSEQMQAQLKGKLAKLRKESSKKGGSKRAGITKEGDAQICIIGMPNSGKSTLINVLTDAKPKISSTPYTTVKPEIGMIDYKGIKLQLIEIPSTFDPAFMSIARSSDLIIFLARSESEKQSLENISENSFIRTQSIFINPFELSPIQIKEKIWNTLGFIIVYARKTKTPMALKKGLTVKEFTERIHKDFIKNFNFARIWRKSAGKERIIQAGLGYILEDGDVVEIHTK